MGRMMVKVRVSRIACAATFIVAVALASSCCAAGAQPLHTCDPVDPVADVGWSVVATEEVVDQADGAPYRMGNDWFVDRTTTLLPFCNYYNDIGNYSLRSYTLAPRETVERVNICKADARGASVAVPPYGGACPPK
jgi:hypothetical protein